MTSEQRAALRKLARAVQGGEEALGVIRAAKLDAVQPVSGLVEKLRELREVNDRRKKIMAEVNAELAAMGVAELSSRWPHFAAVGGQILAMLGR